MYQTTLIRRVDGDIVDLIKSINQKKIVTINPLQSYSLTPRSELVLRLDGTIVSFLDIIINAISDTSGGGNTSSDSENVDTDLIGTIYENVQERVENILNEQPTIVSNSNASGTGDGNRVNLIWGDSSSGIDITTGNGL